MVQTRHREEEVKKRPIERDENFPPANENAAWTPVLPRTGREAPETLRPECDHQRALWTVRRTVGFSPPSSAHKFSLASGSVNDDNDSVHSAALRRPLADIVGAANRTTTADDNVLAFVEACGARLRATTETPAGVVVFLESIRDVANKVTHDEVLACRVDELLVFATHAIDDGRFQDSHVTVACDAAFKILRAVEDTDAGTKKKKPRTPALEAVTKSALSIVSTAFARHPAVRSAVIAEAISIAKDANHAHFRIVDAVHYAVDSSKTSMRIASALAMSLTHRCSLLPVEPK